MKKNYLKYFIFGVFLTVFINLLISNKSYASTVGYTITSYDIDMVVNEDNTFDITETIIANFEVAKHGIFREIPLKNTVTRTDGTTTYNIAKVSNLSVNEKYTTSIENNYYSIQIGSSSKTITGNHTYTIKYTYDIGRDPLDDVDELYYNLIGDEWDTSISNVSFTITMPKEFDESTLGFSSGKTGSTDSSNISYTVNGNVISGTYSGTLSSGEALTVRLTLPEGYFVIDNTEEELYSFFVILISIATALIAGILWLIYGKDGKVIEKIEVYPPEGYNPAETEFMYKGTSSDKGVMSLLIYLANQGYIRIEEMGNEKRPFSGEKGLRLIKLREYDGGNESEKIFFDGIFDASAWPRKSGDNVEYTELCDNFYLTIEAVKKEVEGTKNQRRILSRPKSITNNILKIVAFIIYILITIKPVFNCVTELPNETLIFIYILTTIVFAGILFKSASLKIQIFIILFEIYIMGSYWAIIAIEILRTSLVYFVMEVIGIISIIFIEIFIKYMPRRTELGNKMLGEVGGFKRFIETTDKEQIEELINENPEYFYNIFPYAYAIGVSKDTMKKLEMVNLQTPRWYNSTENFTLHDFNELFEKTVETAKKEIP